MRRARNTAMNALRVMSRAMVGPTLSEETIPFGFSSVEVKLARVTGYLKKSFKASKCMPSISASTSEASFLYL